MTGAVMNSTDPPWSVVVEGIRAGDPSAVEQLYSIFSTAIRLHFLRQLGPQDAEDIAHNTFLAVVTSIHAGKLREPGRLMGYVRTIVHRQVASEIDARVKARRERIDVDADADFAMTLSNRGPDPEQIEIDRERKELAMRILGALPKRDRDVLVRFYLDEQSPERIQQEMALSDTQFRLVKSRALARFGELGRACLRERAPAAAVM